MSFHSRLSTPLPQKYWTRTSTCLGNMFIHTYVQIKFTHKISKLVYTPKLRNDPRQRVCTASLHGDAFRPNHTTICFTETHFTFSFTTSLHLNSFTRTHHKQNFTLTQRILLKMIHTTLHLHIEYRKS